MTEGGGEGDACQRQLVPRAISADLSNLHAQMDYVARSLWDVQKCRLMIGNRRARWSAAPLGQLEDSLEQEERKLNRALASLAKEHPLADWVLSTRGIGLPGFARLMGLTGPLDRFSTPAKLWKFLGMAVVDGRAPQRRKGEAWTHTDCQGGHMQTCPPTCTTDHHKQCLPGVKGTAYSTQGRVVCFQIAKSFVKVGGPYRAHYDRKKAEYLARGKPEPSGCPLGKHHRNEHGQTIQCSKDHIDKAAMRYAVKVLLKDMWLEWRRRARHVTRPTFAPTLTTCTLTDAEGRLLTPNHRDGFSWMIVPSGPDGYRRFLAEVVETQRYALVTKGLTDEEVSRAMEPLLSYQALVEEDDAQ